MRGWLLAGVAWGVTAAACGQLPAGGIEVGKPFPRVVLPSAEDGQAMSIADFRGKKVILHVFASW